MNDLQSIWREFIQVPIPVTASGTNAAIRNAVIYLPSNTDLNNIPVKGIKAVCQEDSLQEVVNGSIINCLNLDTHSRYNITLIASNPDAGGDDIILFQNYPLALLTDIARSGKMLELNDQKINLQKSFITPTQDMTGTPGTFVLQFFI